MNCNSEIVSAIKKNRSLKKKAPKIKNKKKFSTFKEGIDFLLESKLIDKNFYKSLDILRTYRNHIHIQYIEDNKVRIRDFGSNKYNIKIYNGAIKILIKLPEIFGTLITEAIYYFLNKYSHLDRIEAWENTIENIEAETDNIIEKVLKVIEVIDEEHYNAMVKICLENQIWEHKMHLFLIVKNECKKCSKSKE